MNIAIFSPTNSFECVSQFSEEVGIKNPDTFENFYDFSLALCLKQYDMAVCIQDGYDGLKSASTIRKKVPEIPLIYISNKDEFAISSYYINVAMFLKNPFTSIELKSAVEKALKWKRNN